ncbi:hypothetical protein RGU41_10035 [Cryobacterium sp. 10C3]|nr:hypothetical protein [Cryobacterium sp. 10C3]MDY7557055.1 hypothetical protein [Cryobacterium sp. 10C3]
MSASHFCTSTFFTYCWVIEEPPLAVPVKTVETMPVTVPQMSTPPWS